MTPPPRRRPRHTTQGAQGKPATSPAEGPQNQPVRLARKWSAAYKGRRHRGRASYPRFQPAPHIQPLVECPVSNKKTGFVSGGQVTRHSENLVTFRMRPPATPTGSPAMTSASHGANICAASSTTPCLRMNARAWREFIATLSFRRPDIVHLESNQHQEARRRLPETSPGSASSPPPRIMPIILALISNPPVVITTPLRSKTRNQPPPSRPPARPPKRPGKCAVFGEHRRPTAAARRRCALARSALC